MIYMGMHEMVSDLERFQNDAPLNYNKPNNFKRHFPPIKANQFPSVKLNLIRVKGNNFQMERRKNYAEKQS